MDGFMTVRMQYLEDLYIYAPRCAALALRGEGKTKSSFQPLYSSFHPLCIVALLAPEASEERSRRRSR